MIPCGFDMANEALRDVDTTLIKFQVCIGSLMLGFGLRYSAVSGKLFASASFNSRR